MQINIVSLFPDFFPSRCGSAFRGGRRRRGWCEYRVVNPRDFTHDRHRTVDDYPYGGGAGMVLKPEPFFDAVASLAPEGSGPARREDPGDVGAGRRFTHDDAVRLSLEQELTLLCGHYKDIDQRVADGLGGGGGLAGRLHPLRRGDPGAGGRRFGGAAASGSDLRPRIASTDSFYDGMLSPPSYTRPPVYRGMEVPEPCC
jgi:tRNA (guanine37-N1)-methyltransferase